MSPLHSAVAVDTWWTIGGMNLADALIHDEGAMIAAARQPDSAEASPASQRITRRSRCTAAWLPPTTLGFIAAARAAAATLTGCGGEFTQAANRGCAFPNGYGATVAANSASRPPRSTSEITLRLTPRLFLAHSRPILRGLTATPGPAPGGYSAAAQLA